ncbi:monothiol glutaredoxin-mitochondrial precursor [Niveomyces insectorum RCEF 264]|uniref:Monothiol glutaredoxin-5, mitochondrial n=1 Tax=Niveomyces insectorum RCEF 264 TaxID=1081102 RepID=A0A168AA37_9HYPO|nr:monothiol glutaredoxin-mitochondrial precursor [Niveomyces insectorum RCEF 264]
MLTRSITKRLARPARRPAATAAAVVNCASAASFATHSSSSFSTAVVSQRMASLRRPQPLAQRQPRRLAAAPFQQRRLISDHTREAIDRAVASAPVVLFMKGTPELPQCGFSRASIQILGLQGVDPEKFAAFNVLEDAELREGIKEYSDWPTIPQLYVDNEFVGGCDILIAMHQSGELAKLFDEKKVLVAAGEGEAAEASSAEESKKE